MSKITKTYEIEIIEKNDDGGEITITTSAVDRDKDRVLSSGGRTDNYMKNPVVQYGHRYSEPWATIGKTTSLELSPERMRARFDLRPAANEHDPQNIVRLLWAGDWVRAASIGFIPEMDSAVENDVGGLDFPDWELVEWSLVPVPANQEALVSMAKSIGFQNPLTFWPVVVNPDQTLRYAPDRKSADVITSLNGKAAARFYVVELPVDADPEITFMGKRITTQPEYTDGVKTPELAPKESNGEPLNNDDPGRKTADNAPVGDGQPTGDKTATNDNEPNNDDASEPDAALVDSLTELAATLHNITR